MDQLEKIIQFVTDKVMKQLEEQTAHQPNNQISFSFLGSSVSEAAAYYQQLGYQSVPLQEQKETQILIVSELSLYQMTRLVQLTPMNETEEYLLNRILRNQKVVVWEEGMEYTRNKEQIPKAMQQEFEKAKLELRKWGVQFLNHQDLQLNRSIENSSNQGKQTKKKELITADKVMGMNLKPGEIFHIHPNMIVTALAKDYLRDHQIQLEEGERHDYR